MIELEYVGAEGGDLAANCHTSAGAKIKRAEGGRSRPVVVDQAAEWLATLRVQGASPKTCAVYRNALDALGAFVQQLLGHASLRHLAHYLRMTIAELKATHARSKPGQ